MGVGRVGACTAAAGGKREEQYSTSSAIVPGPLAGVSVASLMSCGRSKSPSRLQPSVFIDFTPNFNRVLAAKHTVNVLPHSHRSLLNCPALRELCAPQQQRARDPIIIINSAQAPCRERCCTCGLWPHAALQAAHTHGNIS